MKCRYLTMKSFTTQNTVCKLRSRNGNCRSGCYFFNLFRIFVYFIILSIHLTIAQCPNTCRCSPTNFGLTVSCGPGLSSFPANLPATTEILAIGVSTGSAPANTISSLLQPNFNSVLNIIRVRIAFSDVKTIAPGTFSKLSRLTQLDLRGNKIASLSRAVFTGLSKLNDLILTDNVGCRLDNDVFDDLVSLKTLELGGLGLTSLGKMLTKLNSLQDLDLHGNNLVRLEYASFVNLNNLKHIDVTFNDLHGIQKGMFSVLSNLVSLNLEYNPWRCNCALIWVKSLPSKFVAPSRGSGNGLICDQPLKLAYQDIVNVADSDMKCIPANIVSCNYHVTIMEGQPIDITCKVVGDPFPEVTWRQPDGTNVSTIVMTSSNDVVNFSIPASIYAQHDGKWSAIAENFNGSSIKTIDVDIRTTTTSSTSTSTSTTTTKGSSTNNVIISSPAAPQLHTTPSNPLQSSTLKIHAGTGTSVTVVVPSHTTPGDSSGSDSGLGSTEVVLIVAASITSCVFLLGTCMFSAVAWKSKRKVRIAAKRRSVYSRSDDFNLTSASPPPPPPVPQVHDVIHFKE